MESTLQLEIVTPDKVVVSQTVDYVGVPGIEGNSASCRITSRCPLWPLATSISARRRKTEHVRLPAGSLRFPTTS